MMTPIEKMLADVKCFGRYMTMRVLDEGPRNAKAAHCDDLRGKWRCGYCGTSVMRQCAEGTCAVRRLEQGVRS